MIVLALQFGVPLVQLFDADRPNRFSWQMGSLISKKAFAPGNDGVSVAVVDHDGKRRTITASEIHANRIEMRADKNLARALCTDDPGIVRVRLKVLGDTTIFDCPRP